MKPATPALGTLYLIPTPLDFGCDSPDGQRDLRQLLPGATLDQAASLTHWVVENAKSARAFLKRVQAVHDLPCSLQEMQIAELPRAAHKKGDHGAAGDASAAQALRARVGPRSGPPCFLEPPTMVGAISLASSAQRFAPIQPFAPIKSAKVAPTVGGLCGNTSGQSKASTRSLRRATITTRGLSWGTPKSDALSNRQSIW